MDVQGTDAEPHKSQNPGRGEIKYAYVEETANEGRGVEVPDEISIRWFSIMS